MEIIHQYISIDPHFSSTMYVAHSLFNISTENGIILSFANIVYMCLKNYLYMCTHIYIYIILYNEGDRMSTTL